jgi:predicted DNA-binding transcriptional regulator AlpA
MEDKVGAKFICLEEQAFFELVETVFDRLQAKGKGEKWINGSQVMKMLNISSPTTLQKLRDEDAFKVSQLSKKLIMYDRESVEAYLEKKARKP